MEIPVLGYKVDLGLCFLGRYNVKVNKECLVWKSLLWNLQDCFYASETQIIHVRVGCSVLSEMVSSSKVSEGNSFSLHKTKSCPSVKEQNEVFTGLQG